jgi:hypothetical protein
MRVLEGHGHSCLIAPDLDLASIIDEWLDAGATAANEAAPKWR